MREEAIKLAELGIRVIPIKPGQKYPPMAQWQNKASNDINVVNDWFTSQYSGYGIGIATGATRHGRIFVLDVDDREEYKGSDTLHDLQEKYGQLPETVTAITGTGGQHLYFYCDQDIRNDAGSRLGVGLDIRGEGGQVLADQPKPQTGSSNS
jgi:putative DNA primase/helicase